MSYADVIRSLHGLDQHLSGFLVADSRQVIQDAMRQVENSYKLFAQWKRRTHHKGAGQCTWGFDIPPHRPVRFKRADHIKGYDLRLICMAR